MLYLKRVYLMIFLVLMVEVSCASIFPLPRYFPHFSLLVLVYAALQEGAMTGVKYGLFLGFFMDILSLEYLGTYTFLYTAVGAFSGALRGKVFAEAFVSQWVIPTAAYFFILAGVFLSTPFLDEPTNRLPLFWNMIESSPLLTTTLVSPFVFMFCERFLRKPKPSPRSLYVP